MKPIIPQKTIGNAHRFQRLQNDLGNLIHQTPPGSRLPAEPELAQKLGVSRATLREAMRSYEGQGLIRRRQGVGTFVVPQAKVIDSGLEVLESIETLANRVGLKVSVGALQINEIKADAEIADAMHIKEGTSVVNVSRVIHAENRPVAYLIDILAKDVIPDEDLRSEFTGSALDMILKRKEPRLAKSFTDIQAVSASQDIARKLEIQRGDVLLYFVARLYAESGEVVDYSNSYFLPGYFHFHVIRSVETRGIFP